MGWGPEGHDPTLSGGSKSSAPATCRSSSPAHCGIQSFFREPVRGEEGYLVRGVRNFSAEQAWTFREEAESVLHGGEVRTLEDDQHISQPGFTLPAPQHQP